MTRPRAITLIINNKKIPQRIPGHQRLKARSRLIAGEVVRCHANGFPAFDLLRTGPQIKPDGQGGAFSLPRSDGILALGSIPKAALVPITPYLPSGHSIDPETKRTMSLAFEIAKIALENRGRQVDPAVLAMAVIASANGKHDPNQICDDALAQLGFAP
jgi:hypothetical protein